VGIAWPHPLNLLFDIHRLSFSCFHVLGKSLRCSLAVVGM
jgi:hypothetical protein